MSDCQPAIRPTSTIQDFHTMKVIVFDLQNYCSNWEFPTVPWLKALFFYPSPTFLFFTYVQKSQKEAYCASIAYYVMQTAALETCELICCMPTTILFTWTLYYIDTKKGSGINTTQLKVATYKKTRDTEDSDIEIVNP